MHGPELNKWAVGKGKQTDRQHSTVYERTYQVGRYAHPPSPTSLKLCTLHLFPSLHVTIAQLIHTRKDMETRLLSPHVADYLFEFIFHSKLVPPLSRFGLSVLLLWPYRINPEGYEKSGKLGNKPEAR